MWLRVPKHRKWCSGDPCRRCPGGRFSVTLLCRATFVFFFNNAKISGCAHRRHWQYVSLPLRCQGHQVTIDQYLSSWLTGTIARFGTRLGADPKLEDMMWTSLTDMLSGTPMGVTAENLAVKFNVTRSEFWFDTKAQIFPSGLIT